MRLLQPLVLWAVASTSSELRLRGRHNSAANTTVDRNGRQRRASALVPCNPDETSRQHEQPPSLPDEIPAPPLPPPMPPAKPPLPPEPPAEGTVVGPPPALPLLAGSIDAEVSVPEEEETTAQDVAVAAAKAEGASAASVAVAAVAAAAAEAAIDAKKSPGEVSKIVAEEAKKAGGTIQEAASVAAQYAKTAAEAEMSPVAPPVEPVPLAMKPPAAGTAETEGAPTRPQSVPEMVHASQDIKRELNTDSFQPMGPAGHVVPRTDLQPIEIKPPPPLPPDLQPETPAGLA